MTAAKSLRGFVARHSDPDPSGKRADKSNLGGISTHEKFTAGLAIALTSKPRGRIEIVAFERGETVADMPPTLLDRKLPKIEDRTNGGES